MAQEPDRELFLAVASRREVSEARRIIYCLVNRLSLFLETKREVNRAVEEFRLLLRRRVRQRQNGKRKQQSTSDIQIKKE
jgi:hypothetical protein